MRHPIYSRIDERNLLACRVSRQGFSCFFYSCRYGRRSVGWNGGRNGPGPLFLSNEIFINCNVTRLKTSQKIIRICNNANIFSAEIICPFPTKSVDKVMGRRYSATCWPRGKMLNPPRRPSTDILSSHEQTWDCNWRDELGQLTTHFHPRERQKNYTTPTNKKEKSQLLPELWKSKPKNNLETKIPRKWKCKTNMAPEMNTHAVENLSKKTQRTHGKNAQKKCKITSHNQWVRTPTRRYQL